MMATTTFNYRAANRESLAHLKEKDPKYKENFRKIPGVRIEDPDQLIDPKSITWDPSSSLIFEENKQCILRHYHGKDRDVLILFLQGFDTLGIAGQLGRTPKQIRNILHKLSHECQEILEEFGEEDPIDDGFIFYEISDIPQRKKNRAGRPTKSFPVVAVALKKNKQIQQLGWDFGGEV